MNARLAIAVLALGAACGREQDAIEILAAHRAADIDPVGGWIDLEERGSWMVFVVRKPGSVLWTVDAFRRQAGSNDRSDEFSTFAELSDGVLSLDAQLRGSSHLYLCRFAGEKLLLPEVGVRFNGDSMPSGVVYKRMDRLHTSTDDAKTVVDPLPAGVWEGVDCPEWAWLQVRTSGELGKYLVRRSRLSGDDPTPAPEFTRATLKSKELVVFDPPLFGSASWSLRRIAGGDWLIPATRAGVSADLEGMRFRLVNRLHSIVEQADPDKYRPESAR